VERKRKLRTLFAREGRIWTDEEDPSLISRSLIFPVGAFSSSADDDFNLDETLRRFFSRRESRVSTFVTYDEFDKLEQRIDKLEDRLSRFSELPPPPNLKVVVEQFVSNIQDLRGITKAYFRYDNKILSLFAVVDQFSSDLLEKISEIEIEISRKYPEISIDIEPVLCDDDIAEGSQLIKVKR